MLRAAIARHPFRTLTRDQARYFDVATVYALAVRPDRAAAASNYMKFVDLWKNADPELQPKVAEVKKRLARLSDTERKQ